MSEALRSTPDVEIVPHDAWDRAVGDVQRRSVYHSLGYHLASLHLEPEHTIPVLLRSERAGVLLPLLMRPLPIQAGWDATSAYGYGGPLALTSRSGGHDFGDSIDSWALANGVVTTFLRYEPMMHNETLGPDQAHPTMVGTTVLWGIDETRDLFAGMHAHHRRITRRAKALGVEVRVHCGNVDLQTFREMYQATMTRNNASAFYFFPDQYWAALNENLSEKLLLVEARRDGDVIASLLCFLDRQTLHYHLGASTDAGRAVGANALLFVTAAEWGQATGLSSFHLGGGVGGDSDSPLLTFKRRFDPTSIPLDFYVGKWIHDSEHYASLAGEFDPQSFFPPWRN